MVVAKLSLEQQSLYPMLERYQTQEPAQAANQLHNVLHQHVCQAAAKVIRTIFLGAAPPAALLAGWQEEPFTDTTVWSLSRTWVFTL